MQHMTRDSQAAYATLPTYPTVRAALEAARAEVETMRQHPGQYHYTHATGDYDVADGRTVTVRLKPAVGGGHMLGVHEYSVWTTDPVNVRWRAL